MKKPLPPSRPLRPVDTYPTKKDAARVFTYLGNGEWTENTKLNGNFFPVEDLISLINKFGPFKQAFVRSNEKFPYVMAYNVDAAEEAAYHKTYEEAILQYEKQMIDFREKEKQYNLDLAKFKEWAAKHKAEILNRKRTKK